MTDIETLEQIIYDYIDQNKITVEELVFLLDSIKFELLYNNKLNSGKECYLSQRTALEWMLLFQADINTLIVSSKLLGFFEICIQ